MQFLAGRIYGLKKNKAAKARLFTRSVKKMPNETKRSGTRLGL